MNETAVTINNQENNPNVQEGNLNMFGMQVKISDIIGDKIVDQFMATITPEQMDAITDVIFKEVFEEVVNEEWDESKGGYTKVKSVKFKSKEDKNRSYWDRSSNDTPIYARVKSTLICKYSALIEEKVEEYINSDEYKAKAEQIAKDIIDYAIEGYKKDVIQSIHDRLVLPVTYPGIEKKNVEEIAQNVVMNTMPSYTNNQQSY